MKTQLIVLILVLIIWNCKENQEKAKTKVEGSKKEMVAVVEMPKIIKELAQFAEPTFSDDANIDELMIFKEIDANGTVASINMQRALDLYKAMTISEPAAAMPIFEIKNTDTSILPLQGKGFGGAIWAKVLVGNKTLEIKKIAFEHKAESEDYGAVFTQDPFENQFVGAKINLDENSFILKNNTKQRMVNGTMIDGISGATMTSNGAIDMVNLGLKKYKEYLVPE